MNFILSNKDGSRLGRSRFSCASAERLYTTRHAQGRQTLAGLFNHREMRYRRETRKIGA